MSTANQAEGISKEIHEAPYGNHNNESNDAPEDKLVPLCDFSGFTMRKDISHRNSIEEDDEGNSEEEGYQDAIDGPEYQIGVGLEDSGIRGAHGRLG